MNPLSLSILVATFPRERLPHRMLDTVATNWIGPKAHVTCYPVQRGEIFNFVGQVDRTDWSAEGWFHEGSKEECHNDFPGWHPEVKMMIEGSVRLFKWGLFLREPLVLFTFVDASIQRTRLFVTEAIMDNGFRITDNGWE